MNVELLEEQHQNELKWDRRFLEIATLISTYSKDPSTKVGCVVVEPTRRVIRSTGYNGFARGVKDDDERLNNRELKYQLVVHAEENAILNSLGGASLNGTELYCTWPPCVRCARMMLQVGIGGVCFPDREIPERWRADFDLAKNMLLEVWNPENYRSVTVA